MLFSDFLLGCLEVKNEKIEFTEDGFYFSAFGIQGQQPIQFELKLPLYKEIVPEQSSWNLESVGSFICKWHAWFNREIIH